MSIHRTQYRHLLTLMATFVTGILLPVLSNHTILWWLVGAGLLLALSDWLLPTLTHPLWTLIGKLGNILASAINYIVMALLYLLVIVPIGLALKFKAYKTNQLAEKSESFYCSVTEGRDDKHMERPF